MARRAPDRFPRGAIAGLLSRPACSTNQANFALMKMLQKLVCRCAFAVVALPLLAQSTNLSPPKNIRIIQDSMPSPAQTTNPPPSVIAEGAKLELLAGGIKFTEGATCDAAGNVFFTDQPNNRIMKWSVEGKLSTFLQPAGRANGMYFDAKGDLLACADEKTELSLPITPNSKHTVLAKELRASRSTAPMTCGCAPTAECTSPINFTTGLGGTITHDRKTASRFIFFPPTTGRSCA